MTPRKPFIQSLVQKLENIEHALLSCFKMYFLRLKPHHFSDAQNPASNRRQLYMTATLLSARQS